MKRNEEYTVTMVRCPNCNRLCEKGHDDFNVTNCAGCYTSFVAKEEIEYTSEQYRELNKDPKRRLERSGWVAYDTD